MIAELLATLAGHPSSLFASSSSSATTSPTALKARDDLPYLHPAERQILDELATYSVRYTRVKTFAQAELDSARRRAVRAAMRATVRSRPEVEDQQGEATTAHMVPLCAMLLDILSGYHALVLQIERDVLANDPQLVADKGFVSLANIRARLQHWDAPLSALYRLVDALIRGPGEDTFADQTGRASSRWTGGLLLDLLSHSADTGVSRVRTAIAALRDAVQQSWIGALQDWVCYGQVSATDAHDQLVQLSLPEEGNGSATTSTWSFRPHALPRSISPATADSILYVGRALYTVRISSSSASNTPPASMTEQHVALLRSGSRSLERAIHDIRSDVSEWLFRNVLTTEIVLESLETLGDYLLHRNGPFSLSLLTAVETMRKNKLFHTRSAAAGTIRASDMDLALHRAAMGTSAEDDPCLEKLRFQLPRGTFRPSLRSGPGSVDDSAVRTQDDTVRFDDMLIGVPVQLHYTATFPLDLFLSPADLSAYSRLFSYLVALKKTQARVLECWMSLSKAQRQRRRFTGTGEGGVDPSEEAQRMALLRQSWGMTRSMLWFLDTLLGHIQTDIIDVQYTRLVEQLAVHRDFASLRSTHTAFLAFVQDGTLLSSAAASRILRAILDLCDRFAGLVERWGGDVLPSLLGTETHADRASTVLQINTDLNARLADFFHLLSKPPSSEPGIADESLASQMPLPRPGDADKRVKDARLDADVAARRHLEQLLLRLDFNDHFSTTM